MGSKLGEVSESGSALCEYVCVNACAQHVQYFMVSLTGIEWPNRQQRTVPRRLGWKGSRGFGRCQG